MTWRLCEDIAAAVGLDFKVQSGGLCYLSDLENDLPMSIELVESDDLWIWTCRAVVGELTDEGPDPIRLLMLNSNGLRWCYHALEPFEEEGIEGTSLDLKYTFATPANNDTLARTILIMVLENMRKCALEITRVL